MYFNWFIFTVFAVFVKKINLIIVNTECFNWTELNAFPEVSDTNRTPKLIIPSLILLKFVKMYERFKAHSRIEMEPVTMCQRLIRIPSADETTLRCDDMGAVWGYLKLAKSAQHENTNERKIYLHSAPLWEARLWSDQAWIAQLLHCRHTIPAFTS